MKKYIVIFLLSITCSFAQDKILTTKSDTIWAKITSLENQKVVYYLEADKDKKILELPFASLHKIIWRNGLEYVIDKELDEKLKQIIKPKIDLEKEPIFKSSIKVSEAPELRIKRWIVGRTYTINGQRVNRDKFGKNLYIFSPEDYKKYAIGDDLKTEGRKYTKGGSWISIGSTVILTPLVPLLGIVGFGVSLVVMIVGNVQHFRGNLMMQNAVSNYEYKRKNNYLMRKK